MKRNPEVKIIVKQGGANFKSRKFKRGLSKIKKEIHLFKKYLKIDIIHLLKRFN